MVWSQWFSLISNRRISYTELSRSLVVSTVFLGTPCNGFLWETRLISFSPKDARRVPTPDEITLSPNRASALEAHAAMVDRFGIAMHQVET